MNQRIDDLKSDLFAKKREVSIERAILYTESHKETKGEATIIRRAKATAHIMDNVKISIRRGELLAGNRTIKARSGIISPEMSPYWILDELDTIENRDQDPFFISEHDKDIYRKELYPYWKDKAMKGFINDKLTDSARKGVKDEVVSLNQTDKGQGHITMSFPKLLNEGLGEIIKKVSAKKNKYEENYFYNASLITLKAMQRHILRYAELAEEMAVNEEGERKDELLDIARISKKITKEKPESFKEACQLLWYAYLATQYESNASSLSFGRFDQYMYPFYINDLEKGNSKEQLKEVLESLWVKMNDVVLIRSEKSAEYFGGFPSGCTVALGGTNSMGKSAVNDLSYLALDSYHDIKLPQPNLAVRVNEFMEDDFLNLTSETIRLGTGIPQIFNDEAIIPGFLNRGISLEDARNYSIVGCVELTIGGKMYGLHDIALFNLLKVMEITLKENRDRKDLSFEKVMDNIKKNIDYYVKSMVEGSNIVDEGHKEYAPVPLLSTFIDDCIENGKDITAGGAKYNLSGVQGIGIANLSDSLYALKKIVFEEERITFKELVEALENNFAGKKNEELRQRLINKYDKYGNDNQEVDSLSAEILAYYAHQVEKFDNPRGGKFHPGAYTVSAHIPLGKAVGATPDGRNDGDQLADGGLSPMVGRDKLGPTAVLKSVSQLDNYLTTNGSLLNVKFSPKTIEGIEGINKMSSFLKAFTRLKLQHIQFNVIGADLLKKAQKNPEQYQGLVVRVAGYSAFFVELSAGIQNDIIARTEHSL
ncbi:formate C-acetyltransferase [Halanaerobium congolense]|uniref:formate C-acetyltransferase n=1 Tax=Halanaerobium congolense TaxID=54121 RepID=UPI000890FFD4|nr:formate C-acetyltransferase [Halanaerobium congolense]SDK76340.1 formate C-acetyltransferase [Halanaerobium congolense]SDM49001.1 formate C-acetyltransferase [Halanaerobium congolense]